MATVNIEVVLDDQGVVQGVNKISGQLDQMGRRGGAAFSTMSKQQERARDSAQLLARTFGIEVPRSLEKALTKITPVNIALSGLYKAGVFAAIAAGVGQMVVNFDEWKRKVEQVADAIWAIGSKDMRDQLQADKMERDLMGLSSNRLAMINRANMAGKDGVALLQAQKKATEEELTLLQEKTRLQIEQQYGTQSDTGSKEWTDAKAAIAAMRVQNERATNAEIVKLRRQQAQQLADAELEGAKAGAPAIIQARLQLEADLEKLTRASQGDPKSGALYGGLAGAAQKKDLGDINKLLKDYSLQMHQAVLSEQQGGLQGLAAIEAQARTKVGALQKEFTEKWGDVFMGDPKDPNNEARRNAWVNASADLWKAVNAVNEAGDRERQTFLAKMDLETQQIQSRAALATVPPWLRANAEIAFDTRQRISEQMVLEQQGLITKQALADRVVAIEQEASAKVLDSWSSAYEELFSGGISQMVERNAKQFAARLLAQLTLSGGPVGNTLGAVLSPIFGLPAPAGSANLQGPWGALANMGTVGLGVGLGMPIPGMGSQPLLSGNASLLGLGNIFGGGTAGGGGYSASSTGGIGGGGFNLSTIDQALGIPGASSIPVTPAKIAGGGLLSNLKGSLGGLAPIFGAMLGGKVGGIPGTIGMGMAGLAASGLLMGNSQALSILSFLGTAATAGIAGGGIGLGVGMQHGPLAGSISGGGTGALIGLAMGGPIGALIGGLIGVFSGIFGGLFGGGQRRRQAEQFAQNQMREVQKVVDAYKGFQIDYASALDQLESMKSNAWEQMKALKGEGRDVYNRTLLPAFTRAEGDIKGYQDERERRMGLVFGPPQFASGGYFAGYGARSLPGGGQLAVLHPGEFIMNPDSTARFRPQLEQMNQGAPAAGGIELHLHTLDGKTTEAWLRNGGGALIYRAVRGYDLRARQEGW